MDDHAPATEEGGIVWAAFPLFVSQMRLGPGGVVGLDYTACAAIVRSQGVGEEIFAPLFTFLEAGVVAAASDARDGAGSQGSA